MKKIILSLAALAALSSAALAERHYDLRDTPTAMGTIGNPGEEGTNLVLRDKAAYRVVLQSNTVIGEPNDIDDAHGFKR